MEGGRKARWLEGVLVVARACRGDCVLGEEEMGGEGLLQLLGLGWLGVSNVEGEWSSGWYQPRKEMGGGFQCTTWWGWDVSST